MYPKLFHLPFLNTYGLMIGIGFVLAVIVVRALARSSDQDPDHITNVAMYALIAGIVGARIFYVIHNYSSFETIPSMFAVWKGGLEFLGGVILAVFVLLAYLLINKLPVRRYLDMLAIVLLLASSFGRLGCFLNGCCFGKPTDVKWAVRFPYASDAYECQAFPNPDRNRQNPQLELPAEYFGYIGADGRSWLEINEENKFRANLKPRTLLTKQQEYDVTKGPYRCLPVHPSQLYSSLNSLCLTFIIYLFWRKFGLKHPGCTISFMFVLYGFTRFWLEFLRDDNPFEQGWWTIHNNWTVSQNLGIYLAAIGLIATIFFAGLKPKKQ